MITTGTQSYSFQKGLVKTQMPATAPNMSERKVSATCACGEKRITIPRKTIRKVIKLMGPRDIMYPPLNIIRSLES
jgi:hypothetical protein